MSNRRILSAFVSVTIVVSTLSLATVASASSGHDEDETEHAAEHLESTPEPAASTDSADTGTVGTAEAPREVAISMTDDLRFDPGEVVVIQGETIRFLLRNPTAAAHDFTLGDVEMQEQHHDEMAAGMSHGHDGEEDGHDGDENPTGMPGPVSLEPGESVEVVATFDEAGEMLIGCHVPGHWEAGMRGTITVLPAASV